GPPWWAFPGSRWRAITFRTSWEVSCSVRRGPFFVGAVGLPTARTPLQGTWDRTSMVASDAFCIHLKRAFRTRRSGELGEDETPSPGRQRWAVRFGVPTKKR